METGLHYNLHRYYASEAGRYFRSDPIGLAGGVNIFLYTHNNPLVYVDPLGLVVTGHGGGVTAARSMWISQLFGVGGSFAGMKITDENGNTEYAIYYGFGISYIGSGYVAGYQKTKWFEAKSICELHNPFNIDFNVGLGLGAGVGGSVSASPSQTTSILGIGKGGFGGSLGIINGCWMPNYEKRCKKWEECVKERTLELLLQRYQSRGTKLPLPDKQDPYECCRDVIQ